MAGILGYGAYIPLYRIERSRIAEQYGDYAGDGETAVPGHDEDTTTMAVEAATDALTHASTDGDQIDAVFAATTSDPFVERGVAAHVAHAVGAGRDTRVGDFQGSARAGTNALLAARDALSTDADTVLVVGSDALSAPAGSAAERTAGAGAGALVFGEGDAVAALTDSGVATTGFVGRFATHDDVTGGDGRFNRERYLDAVESAVGHLGDDSFTHAVFPAHDGGWGRKASDALGLDATLVSTFPEVGYTAAAGVFLDTAAALDTAKAGESVLLAGYGPGGCDALRIERRTAETPEMTTDEYIQSSEQLPYGKHRQFRTRGGN